MRAGLISSTAAPIASGHEEAAGEVGHDLGGIAGTERLGGKGRRAHAQEAEDEIDDAHRHGAERHGRQVMRRLEVADEGRVDGTQERH